MTSLTRLTTLILGATSLSLLGITGAFADTTSTSGTFGPSNVAATTNVTLNKFNSSLGTLNSVTLTLNGNFTITLTVDNTVGSSNPTPTDKTFSSASAFVTNGATGANPSNTNVGITATGPDGTTLNLTESQLALVINSSNTSAADRTVAANTTKNYTGTVNSTAQTVLTSNLSAYQGSGGSTFNVTVDNGDIFAGGSGGLGLGYSAVAPIAGTVTAVYNYTAFTNSAAPEPGSFAMVGMGLVSMGGIALRRRKSANAA